MKPSHKRLTKHLNTQNGFRKYQFHKYCIHKSQKMMPLKTYNQT